jgi:thioredoxin-dependent peroxiredoxin
MTLSIGDAAPAFSFETDTGPQSLAALTGKAVALYFYPKDDTSGCTKEAQEFTALKAGFDAANTVVIGVSKDSVASHARFRKKYDLAVALGSDPDGVALEAYGVWVEKSMYGRAYMGIERATYLIDGKGVVRGIWRKVKVPGHAAEVLKAAQAL